MALCTRQNELPGKRVARHESVANEVIDLHAGGAIFRPWPPLDGRSQRGPDAAIAVESARVPFSTPRIFGRRLPVRSARSLRPAIGAVHRRLYERWHAAACPPRRSVPQRHALKRSKRLPGRDHWDGSDPPRRWHGRAHQPAPLCRSGRQKRGVAPVHLRFPRAAPPSREASRNPNGDSQLEERCRAHRRALMVHMPPIVSGALPERHGTPLFSGQDRPPGIRLEPQIPKPAGRTTTADQRRRTDAGCRLSPARKLSQSSMSRRRRSNRSACRYVASTLFFTTFTSAASTTGTRAARRR